MGGVLSHERCTSMCGPQHSGAQTADELKEASEIGGSLVEERFRTQSTGGMCPAEGSEA